MTNPTFEDLKIEFRHVEKEYEIARDTYNEILEALQAACKHQTIVGGNEEYGDSDQRVCVDCGLYEVRGYEGGDEYNYGYRTSFKVMPIWIPNPNGRGATKTGRRAYKPDSYRDIYRWVRSKK